jgi:hypothetical protein
VAICCVSIAPLDARADAIGVTSSLTLNFLDGKHDTGTGIDRLHFVPLPLADLDARYRRTTLHLEGLPALTFGYGSGPGARQYTRLSIINVTLRESFTGGTFAGIGQTIYNQRTFYPSDESNGVASQGSRVTGARFEPGFIGPAFRTTRVEYVFAVNPAMHGLERTALRAPARSPEVLNAEYAVQVDTSLRFVSALPHGDLLYGLRYLNYASRFDLRGTPVDGLLADRNVGLMPLIGYRVRF